MTLNKVSSLQNHSFCAIISSIERRKKGSLDRLEYAKTRFRQIKNRLGGGL